jgi:hypothetical protein
MIFKYLLIIQFELFKCAFVAEVDKHTHTGEKNIALLQDWPINFKRLLIIQFELIQCAMTRQIVKTKPISDERFWILPQDCHFGFKCLLTGQKISQSGWFIESPLKRQITPTIHHPPRNTR